MLATMGNSLFLYLAEASFGVAVFSGLYRLLLAKLTYFAWNRAYLLLALGASLGLPLFGWPGLADWLVPAASGGAVLSLQWHWQGGGPLAAVGAAPVEAVGFEGWLPGVALVIYVVGAGFRLWGLGRDLRWVYRLVRHNPRVWSGGYWLVQVLGPSLPAFSFGRFVFLSAAHDQLSAVDRQLVLLHEAVHVRQRHTQDLLLAELVGVMLWFNPLLRYLKNELKNVHEYLADHAVVRTTDPQYYGRLLVHLAAQQPPVALVHALSSKQIFSRIHILTQPNSSPMKKLRFLSIIPVAAGIWLATSAFNLPAGGVDRPAAAQAYSISKKATSSPIGRIIWQGNTVVSVAKLNQVLGLKSGDAYDSVAVEKRLGYNLKGGDVSSLYLDQGYMFFSVTPTAKRQPNGTVDLTFALAEGPQVRVRNVVFVGSKKMSVAELTRLASMRSGELFSRAKLMQAQQNLVRTGLFDPQQMRINPKPVMKAGGMPELTDVEFVLVEKK